MDAPWNDIERKSAEMADARTPIADSIRFYLNGLATEEDAWIEPAKFDALAEPKTVNDGDRIALFLDCSKSGDATGLVACRLDDMFVFLPFGDSVWERPHGLPSKQRWLAPREEVDAKVRAAMQKWDVVWFGVDPSPAEDDSTEALYWRAVIDGWHRDYRTRLSLWATPGDVRGHSVLFDMRTSKFGGSQRNQLFTETAEMVAEWIDEEGVAAPLRHDGHPQLRTHTHNAKRRPNQWGTSLAKVTRDSSKHVDLAVCMVGSIMGARIALNSGKLGKKRPVRRHSYDRHEHLRRRRRGTRASDTRLPLREGSRRSRCRCGMSDRRPTLNTVGRIFWQFIGVLLLVGFVGAYFWWIIAGGSVGRFRVAGDPWVSAAPGPGRGTRNGELAAELAARADQEHRRARDERGVYGQYPAAL